MANKYRDYENYLKEYPNSEGYFGEYGGAYIPDTLKAAMAELKEAYLGIAKSATFINELRRIRKDYQGRPTPLYHCERLSRYLGLTQIYLKREDLNHTGAHKLNHCMGEVMLAKHMGKKKVIAETGAGMHGVALATAAAYFGLKCDIYMGALDVEKQATNVTRMKVLGAKVIPVMSGSQDLKEAIDVALDNYSYQTKTALYCIGSVVGPHPFPMIVRQFQSVMGIEAREQFLEMTGHHPDALCASVGGGSNAMGLFIPYIADPVEFYGVEPLGIGPEPGNHAASLTYGRAGVLQGYRSYLLQDDENQPLPVYSNASGLDHPSIGPEHAWLKDIGRAQYVTIDDAEAIDAFFLLCRLEGIIPALESAHALAYAIKLAKENSVESVLVNMSGRGDKDLDFITEKYGFGEKYDFLLD